MQTHTPTRQEAFSLLTEFNKSESLIKHALSVEGVMRYDLDYEIYPDQHCQKTKEILEERGWPEEYIRAIMSHGWGLVTNVEPQHEMEKVLYAIDELTGLVTAVALVRPSRSVLDMKPKSVAKKWKDKSFAAGANRQVIANGAEMLGIDLKELFEEVIMGMREVADKIGLAGSGGNYV